MRAFPQQFPYGNGYHEDFNDRASVNGYLKHLLSLSIPVFHEACFVLTVHNMYERGKALTGALWRVMGGGERCDVSEEELNVAIEQKLKGVEAKAGPGKKFLDSVEAVKRRMAHGNGAAQAARAKFLSLNHHFGCPKVLFTVAFDDALDIRILALSGMEDAAEWIDSLDTTPPEELHTEMDRLNTTRYRYPGLCAFNFESLMDVVLDKIVGDNPTRTGIFGKLEAYGMAVEEQGRKTLHAHILVYTTDWGRVMEGLHSNDARRRKWAEKQVTEFVDRVISTELTPNGTEVQKCPNCKADLTYADDQRLRNLRHRHGCRYEKGIFAACNTCRTEYQGDELAAHRVLSSAEAGLDSRHRDCCLRRRVLGSQVPGRPIMAEDMANANLVFNQHLPFHTRTCFKKGDECRSTHPEAEEAATRVLYGDDTYKLYAWTGEPMDVRNITVRPRRLKQDAYTNVHCRAISASKCPSNSNVQVTTGARATIYTSCYASKSTQKEDTGELKKMSSYVANRFVEERKTNQLFEGLSRLMGAVIVGTGEHVCAAPMAAYLVRNDSRFKFSHTFEYVPVREMVSILTQGNSDSAKMTVLSHGEGCFLTNKAMHYLKRPKAFESCNVVDFFEQYEIKRNEGITGEREIWEIDDAEHPGYQRQEIRKRLVPALAQFSHWALPDAEGFGGDIRTMNQYPVPTSVENYCRTILVLFKPFRTVEDLRADGSYHKMFRRVYHNGVPERVSEILGNAQMFYNSMRLPAKEDPLFDGTTPFRSPDKNGLEDEDEEDTEDNFFDGVFTMMAGQTATADNAREEVHGISLGPIRKQGGRGCGFDNLPENIRPPKSQPEHCNFIEERGAAATEGGSRRQATSPSRDKPTPYHLMELTYRKTRRRVEEHRRVDGTPADGTARSIVEWSNRPELTFDEEQKLSFQIVTAAFIATYYEDAAGIDPSAYEKLGSNNRGVRHDFNRERRRLKKLARLKKREPMRMFLDGAGGAGKSHVVGELLQYGRSFTEALGLQFDTRTIIVTALSGVAAVSIRGETLHSAAALNREVKLDDHSWANARLLIIDEVSFMSTSEVDLLDEKLRSLMGKPGSAFGGMHLLYCGDFRQLEPISGHPLYTQRHSEKKWANSINCYVELLGLHRFKDDPAWGRLLRRLRTNTYTQHDIDEINRHMVKNGKAIPDGASYCVYGNRDRTAINAAIFTKVLEAHWNEHSEMSQDIIAIKASNMVRYAGKKKVRLEEEDKRYIYERCGDSCVRAKSSYRGSKSGHFVDPLLKLYRHIPLMLVSNDDVTNGHANGTRVRLEKVVLKDRDQVSTMTIDRRGCKVTEASNVEHLLCTLEGDPGKEFKIKPREMRCEVQAPVPRHIAGQVKAAIKLTVGLMQVPIIANNATTGHKLQGQTKQNLAVSVWSQRKNWNYVALSRVRTRGGLYVIQPLPYTADFAVSAELSAMTHSLSEHHPGEIDWEGDDEMEDVMSRN